MVDEDFSEERLAAGLANLPQVAGV
jgi:hypothetical protein